MATITANNLYEYNKIYFNNNLNYWIQETHKYNSEYYKWNYYLLKKGAFGYDNIAISIGLLFDKIINDNNLLNDIESCASIIHDGWCINYTFWRDNEPWLKSNNYFGPAKPLNDERRNECAKLHFQELPTDEKEKDIIIAKFLIDKIKSL